LAYICGVDIGGTFTDCVLLDDRGNVTLGKAPSTPPDFHQGFLDSLQVAAGKAGISLESLVAGAKGRIFHGCTVGTNALVERKGARVGLITTRGHRDAIHIMLAAGRVRGLSPEELTRVAATKKPDPIVPKHFIAEVDERVTWDGNVLVELNEESVASAIQALLERGAEAIAVSLLWSVVNPAHEQAIKEMIERVAPGMFVSLSSEVVPRVGEYERTVATVMNAYIGPVMNQYLEQLEQGLAELGHEGSLQMMSCSGGLIDAKQARVLPVLTIGSGPVAGLIGARQLGVSTLQGQANILTTDMGGTSFDVGMIYGSRPVTRTSTIQSQYEYFLPTVDVRSVGAGGGSIIYFDANSGTLRVGPHSAGSRPGPACYGRGGTQAAVTDADLVLGYLDPDYFLGGDLRLDLRAARKALKRAGEPLGFGPEETAAAAARIVDNHMADAIRLMSIQQGYDPRNFVVYAYGGAGPVHASAYARELGVKKITVPLSDFAAGWSAFGVASSEAVFIQELARFMRAPFDPDLLNGSWQSAEESVLGRLAAQGIPHDRVRLDRFAGMRYALQINEVEVSAVNGRYDEASGRDLIEAFEQEYARLYGQGTGYAEAGFEIRSIKVVATARVSDLDLSLDRNRPNGETSALKGERSVMWYEQGLSPQTTRVYDGMLLRTEEKLAGPAIIEFPDTTVVVRHGQTAMLDPVGSIDVLL
jgi:N-methylhydantoinase A